MIISVTLSKPTSKTQELLGNSFEKIKIKVTSASKSPKSEIVYFVEMFTKQQVFHQHFTELQLESFLKENIGITFKSCVERTENEIITFLTNKKGKTTKLVSPIVQPRNENQNQIDKKNTFTENNKKKYLLPEGTPVPFLVLLGIMTDEGKVVSNKYDKFKQINRFLEFIDDTVNSIDKKFSAENPLRIADFGCGKSYLTFAVHYFLTNIKKIPCEIEGLDLKEDVITYCNKISQKLNLQNLIFHTGNIADYAGKSDPNIIITLHACDTATDFALKYAVQNNADAILSVPCCQHQINSQLNKLEIDSTNEIFLPLLKYGIIKERFSALLTDALRGEWLENQGYKVQLLEFIDIESTPKNILIRAIKRKNTNKNKEISKPTISDSLKIQPEIWNE